jgi:hypothetical protein
LPYIALRFTVAATIILGTDAKMRGERDMTHNKIKLRISRVTPRTGWIVTAQGLEIWSRTGGASEDEDHLWKAMAALTTDQATSVPPNGFAWEFMRTVPSQKGRARNKGDHIVVLIGYCTVPQSEVLSGCRPLKVDEFWLAVKA